MKKLVLLALFLCQTSFAGAGHSKAELAIRADAKQQAQEILAIRDLHEFERRWTGFVNRANSEPWKSTLQKFGARPERLLERCVVGTDSQGNRYCDGIINYACPRDESTIAHNEQVGNCHDRYGDDADKLEMCLDHADSALNWSNLACVASDFATSIGDAFSSSSTNHGGDGAGSD